jgi:hypothetical protein
MSLEMRVPTRRDFPIRVPLKEVPPTRVSQMGVEFL